MEATIAQQLEAVSLLWNSFATQVALQAATARGIEAHPSAPGVTEAPTHG